MSLPDNSTDTKNTHNEGNHRPQPHLGWALLLTLYLVGVQLAVGIGFAIIVIVSGVMRGKTAHEATQTLQNSGLVLLPVATLSTFLAALAVVVIVFKREIPRKLSWRRCTAVQWLLVLLLVVPLAVVSSEIANWAMEALHALGLKNLASFGVEPFEQLGKENWALILISACLLPAFGEEIFFRGFLSRGLVAWHGVIAGSIMASFLFAVVHFFPVQVCATFVMGLALQYVFLTTRSLLAPIVLHTLNNALAFAMMKYGHHIPIEGLTATADDSVSHSPFWLVLSALAATTVLLFLFYRTRTWWLKIADSDGALTAESFGELEWSPGFFVTNMPSNLENVRAATRSGFGRPQWIGAAILLIVYAWFAGSLALICSQHLVK